MYKIKLVEEQNVRKNNIKISIIVPVYNTEQYLERCIKSLINQTLDAIEIILVNDGSTDNSYQKCIELSKIDPRIRVYNKKNEGLGYTRNYGISVSSGEYVAFIDSDDYVDFDFFEKLYKKSLENKSDAVFGNMKLVDSSGKVYLTHKIPFKYDKICANHLLKNLLKIYDEDDYGKNFFGMSAARSIYKLDILKNNNILFKSEREYVSEDILFNIEFCLSAKTISFVEDSYYYYCYNQNSLTHSYRSDRFLKSKKLYNELKFILKRDKNYKIYKRGIESIFLDYVRLCIKQQVMFESAHKKKLHTSIKNILNDSDVVEALNEAKSSKLTQRTIDYIIKKRNIGLIVFIYKIKIFMEKRD